MTPIKHKRKERERESYSVLVESRRGFRYVIAHVLIAGGESFLPAAGIGWFAATTK